MRQKSLLKWMFRGEFRGEFRWTEDLRWKCGDNDIKFLAFLAFLFSIFFSFPHRIKESK